MAVRVAVAAVGTDENAMVSPAFARAPYFLIFEVEGDDAKLAKALQNMAASVPSGAAVLASRLIIQEGCSIVVAGNYGPRALELLQQAGVRPLTAMPMPAKQAAILAAKGELPEGAPRGRHGWGWKER